MSEEWRSMIRARAAAARYPIGAAALVAVLAWSGGAPGLACIAGVLAVAGAALIPVRAGEARGARKRLDGAASDLASSLPDTAALLSALPDPVIVFDGEQRIVGENEAARSAFGSSPAMLGVRMKFRAPELRSTIARAVEGGETGVLRGYATPAGDRWFDVHVVPVRGSGAASGDRWIMVLRDQTAARRDARVRSDFIANASHELRTPLASLMGYIETLRGPARNDAPARERFLGIMAEQAARMARLVEDLMSLSRAERRARQRPDEIVDLTEIVGNAVDAASPAFVASDVTLAIEGDAGPCPVRGDRDELSQVLANLIENALRYGGEGGRVVVELRRAGGVVEVDVRDFGAGIAPEHLPRLTERFYRVDVARSRERRGTGLGLAIVKHILARHRSVLKIRSEPGRGASFGFSLPTVFPEVADSEAPSTH